MPPDDTRPLIGITTGDAAGIGPEVAAAALASGELDPGFAYRRIGKLPPKVRPGQPTRATAQAAWAALEEAARLALAGELAAVVTGPVCKANLYAEGFSFPGQTEFFADRCGVENFAMLLTGGRLTVALVSTHLPLADAVRQLATAEIVRVGTLLADFLHLRLRRTARIAVAGLNPHAGENGMLGREEIDVIAPAVRELQARHGKGGAEFAGPVPPDTVFHQAAQGQWDAVVCMYHDQGLIPLKLHAFDEGVNVTLGLPIIRTSPDHGTAFGLAGKGAAHPGSMIAAIRLATELAVLRAGVASPGGN
jgi:4-hydroxythreonine-4-phosphate dehydrogenase